MKIQQLLSGLKVVLTNEEKNFVKKYSEVKISALNEHDQWIVQNLVRKGIYLISNDNNTLIRA
jgi:hypothetical protein